jgi:hypothetical protein
VKTLLEKIKNRNKKSNSWQKSSKRYQYQEACIQYYIKNNIEIKESHQYLQQQCRMQKNPQNLMRTCQIMALSFFVVFRLKEKKAEAIYFDFDKYT